MRIILTGGGSGGHLIPLITVAKKITVLAKERGIEDISFLYVGPRFNHISDEMFKREDIAVRYIMRSKLRRYSSFLNFIDLIKFPFSILHAIWIMFWNIPDAVFSKGGAESLPVMFAAWLFMVPSRVIHESDSVPGLSNKITSIFAKRIGVAFESAALKFPIKKTAVVGLPAREGLCNQDVKKAQEFFNIQTERKVVLFIGGSQGARKVNSIAAEILPRLINKYEVIHICGPLNYEAFKKELHWLDKSPNKNYYHLYPFLTEEMKLAFTLAGIVISRAGANSIFEIASCGKPSILIPLPGAAQDHQRKNAYEYAKSGATIVMEEDNLTPNLLFSNISSILDDQNTINRMASNALTFPVKDSAELIAKEVLRLRGVV